MILDSPIITGSLVLSGSIVTAPGGAFSGSFSGSFEGNGSGLTGITAEWDGTHTGPASFIGNVTASGAVSASGNLTIGGTSTLKGNNTLGTNGAGSSHIVYGGTQFTDTLQVDSNLTANANITLGNAITDTITVNGHVTASGHVSSSITSTASFGTYVGDGSQLLGISTTPFPFVGDAQISGSLSISGSFLPPGHTADNLFIGRDAGLVQSPSNDKNTFIGVEVGKTNIGGERNTAIGFNAMMSGNNDRCVFIGTNAGLNNASSNKNIGIGMGALQADAGDNNVVIGYFAGNSCTSDANTLLGHYAGSTLTGNGNIALGYYAGQALTDGDGNIFIGSGSLGAAGMADQLRIGNNGVHIISGSLTTGDVMIYNDLSASAVSASTYFGDGSNLTGISAGGASGLWSGSADSMYTGDGSLVYVSGSLIVSQSYTVGDTDSTALKVMGSGSVSGSAIFEVQGQNTTLFSVTDDLTDELFAANDASGLSIISAFADRTVKLGKPGGFGIVISGSNPMPSDVAAKIFITGSTYYSGSVADFTSVGAISGSTFSGSYVGDGAGLTNVAMASGVLSGSAQIATEISGGFLNGWQNAGITNLKNDGTQPSEIRLYCETSNAHYLGLKNGGHSGGGNYSLAFPPAAPTVNDSLLTVTTAGIASWTPFGSGSFSGSFEGDGSNLTGISAGSSIDTGSLGNTIVTGSLTVTGHIAGATKSFLIDHPTKTGYKLQYGVLEGPEHGVYVRGQLTNENIIELPEEWVGLVHADSITVQLTPIGSICTHYVQDISDNKVHIDCECGTVNCFFFIQGERKDVGKLKTELG